MTRRKKPPQRTRGRVHLLSDPQRFALSAWIAFQWLGPTTAAYLAAVLVESDEPIAIESIENMLSVVSSRFDPKTTTLEERAKALARKSRRILQRGSEGERRWLLHSAGLIAGVIRFSADGNQTGIARALVMLEAAGWHSVIERVHRRIGGSLRTNIPDFTGQLGRLGRSVLKSVWQKREADQGLLR